MAGKNEVIRTPLSYNKIDADRLATVLKSYEGRHHEAIVRDMERQVSQVTGADHVAAVQSGTASMHLALLSVGVSPGDVVIAPTFAYVACVSPVIYAGARLVLVDAEEATWNMDPLLLRKAMQTIKGEGHRLGAIVVVHNYGIPARLHDILEISNEFGVPLIEDAAESFGTTIDGKWTGTLGAIGIYSFNSNKTITGFGGGALVSSNEGWIRKARYLAAHARSEVPYYQHDEIGFNYRISPLEAACVMTQLESLDALFGYRRIINQKYLELGGPRGIRFQECIAKDHVQPWLTCCLLPKDLSPEVVLERFSAAGIEGRRLWKPMHMQPAFRQARVFGGEVSEGLFRQGICLPHGSYGGDPPDFGSIIDLISKA